MSQAVKNIAEKIKEKALAQKMPSMPTMPKMPTIIPTKKIAAAGSAIIKRTQQMFMVAFVVKVVITVLLIAYYFKRSNDYDDAKNNKQREKIVFEHTVLFGVNYGILYPIIILWWSYFMYKIAMIMGLQVYQDIKKTFRQ